MNLFWFIGGLSAYLKYFLSKKKKLQVNVIISVCWRSQWDKILIKKKYKKKLIEK